MKWQPIATAPTDWSLVDLWVVDRCHDPHRIADCRASLYNGEPKWYRPCSEYGEVAIHQTPTHWMPLPPPPNN